jgi:RNA polymerase sigma-70 factor, ECF subfamily
MNFWDVYDQHYFRIKKFIQAMVRDEYAADDLCQETFMRVQSSLDTLKDESKISSWIFQIAYNLCRDHFRKLKTRRAGEHVNRTEVEILVRSSIQKELEQNEMSECVQQQVNLLPESLRTVIILFDLMGCTHEEVSEIVGISREAVKVRLHRARKRLKALLEQACTFETDERSVLVCEPKGCSSSRNCPTVQEETNF